MPQSLRWLTDRLPARRKGTILRGLLHRWRRRPCTPRTAWSMSSRSSPRCRRRAAGGDPLADRAAVEGGGGARATDSGDRDGVIEVVEDAAANRRAFGKADFYVLRNRLCADLNENRWVEIVLRPIVGSDEPVFSAVSVCRPTGTLVNSKRPAISVKTGLIASPSVLTDTRASRMGTGSPALSSMTRPRMTAVPGGEPLRRSFGGGTLGSARQRPTTERTQRLARTSGCPDAADTST